MATKRFIAIAGNIGSGKTTLTQMLSEHYRWEPHYEVVAENPYLADFYGDMNRWSLQLQVFFLSQRFQAHQTITRSDSSAIQDRSIYEDAHIFARALFEQGDMDARDYENYNRLYQSMIQFLRPPTLMIFLRRSVPKLMERIHQRGRDYEQSISYDYLTRLNQYYDEWYDQYEAGNALVIQTDELDFLDNEAHFNLLVGKMHDSIAQRDLFYQQ